MKVLYVVLAVFVAGAALLVRPVYAHGFGERTELPVPLGFFLIGAGVTVGVSFIIIGMFSRGNPGHSSYWRYNLYQHQWLHLALTSRLLLLPVKLLSVFLLALVIAAGLFGDQAPPANFAPTFVWIVWWIGMGFVVALAGNLWALINPWTILFEWAEILYLILRPGPRLSPARQYPQNWGIWPAILLFLCFTWIQDAFVQSPLPNRVAVMTLIYTVITLGGMAIFGKHQWLRHGEAFSVVFSLLAKFAPTEVRVQDDGLCSTCGAQCLSNKGGCVNCYECFSRAETKELNIRPFAIGLTENGGKTNDVLAMVVLLLATVTFDGFSATQTWVDIQMFSTDIFISVANGPYFNGGMVADSLGVLLLPVIFLVIYLAFSRLISGSAGSDLGAVTVARTFAYSLIPIALAYNIAHFITLLLIQGQLIIPLTSDPFGYGWNLLGTEDYRINIGVINARGLWYASVGLIIVGHIIAVYLAHRISLRTFQDKSAAISSQYPMLMLMVIYTVVSLWTIAQPIVR